MHGTSRRSLLVAAGGALALPGCLGSAEPEPPDVEWSVEEEVDAVSFVHDGGEPITDPQQFVVAADGATAYSRYRRDGEPVQEELNRFRPAARVDGELQYAVPERIEEGDAFVASGSLLETHFTDGSTFDLVWRAAEDSTGALSDDSAAQEVVASHELSGQRDEPPDAEWRTEETDDQVRFVHDGGDAVYGPVIREPGYNDVFFRYDDLSGSSGVVEGGPARWLEEGDAIEFSLGQGIDEEVRLVWRNRHGTEDVVLATHELQSGGSA